MAKGVGLYGNFRGKVGNTVGYTLKDSNNKQTQGVRIYQPVVKNPKTYAQAAQRCMLAPINATYRALKPIIDRGQEGLAYGNKSRLAWLSNAMKHYSTGWFVKGAEIVAPAIVPLTKGSLNLTAGISASELGVEVEFGTTWAQAPTTVGALAADIIANNIGAQEGDQITVVALNGVSQPISAVVKSIVLDSTSTVTLASLGLTGTDEGFKFSVNGTPVACAIILSREGSNGQHLRSTSSLKKAADYPAANDGDEAKEDAIKSYMSAAGNSDWPEESIQ